MPKSVFTPEQLNAIHMEFCDKENAACVIRQSFTLDMRRYGSQVVDGKFGAQTQVGAEKEASSQSSRPRDDFSDEVTSSLKKIGMTPKERYLEPLTSSHSIGWNHNVANLVSGKFRQRWGLKFCKNTCDVTKFANDYAAANGNACLYAKKADD